MTRKIFYWIKNEDVWIDYGSFMYGTGICHYTSEEVEFYRWYSHLYNVVRNRKKSYSFKTTWRDFYS